MSDPYADAFARDYMASKDFARMYGTDQPVVMRFFQFGTKEAKDPTNYSAPARPRPVVWFVEHQDLPMFVNNTQHEYLLDRFGNEYWTNANRNLILHAPVRLRCWSKKARDGAMYIVEMSGFPKNSQWDPIGDKAAEKLREQAKDLDFTRDGFRRFVHQCYPELIGAFDHAEGLHDLSLAFKTPYDEYLRELRGNMGRHDAPPEKPAQPKHADPSPEPNFDPPEKGSTTVTEDDIPF